AHRRRGPQSSESAAHERKTQMCSSLTMMARFPRHQGGRAKRPRRPRSHAGAILVAAAAGFAGLSVASMTADAGAVAGFPNFYESVKSATCKSSTSCLVDFDKVPDGFLLQATDINCVADTIGPNF